MAGQALGVMAAGAEAELAVLDMMAAQWRDTHAEAAEPVIVYMVFDAMAAKKQSLEMHKSRVWWDRYSALRVLRAEIVDESYLFVVEEDSCLLRFFAILEVRSSLRRDGTRQTTPQSKAVVVRSNTARPDWQPFGWSACISYQCLCARCVRDS
jgi:hypothetical protein